MAPHILDLSNEWGGSFTPRPLYPAEREPTARIGNWIAPEPIEKIKKKENPCLCWKTNHNSSIVPVV